MWLSLPRRLTHSSRRLVWGEFLAFIWVCKREDGDRAFVVAPQLAPCLSQKDAWLTGVMEEGMGMPLDLHRVPQLPWLLGYEVYI